MVSKLTGRKMYGAMRKKVICCELCGSNDHAPALEPEDCGIGIRMTLCRDCGFLFMNPRPLPEEMNEFYRSGYRKSDANPAKPPKNYDEKQNALARANWFCSILQPKFKAAKLDSPAILDVGCGAGMILHAFGKHFPKSRLFGVEPSPTFSAFAEKMTGASVFRGDMETYALQNAGSGRSFDLIILNHVLEHLFDPVEKLKTMRDWLAPRGLILIQVPTPFAPEQKKILRMLHIAHVNQFSARTLRMALERAGFTDIEEHKSSPRVLTILARKDGLARSSGAARLADGEAERLVAELRAKALAEHERSGLPETPPPPRLLSRIRRRFDHWRNARALGKLFRGRVVAITGSSATAEELKRVPGDAVLCTANLGLLPVIEHSNGRPVAVYFYLQKLLKKRKKLAGPLADLERANVRMLVTDNPGAFSTGVPLLRDNGYDDHYLKRLFSASEIASLQRNAGAWMPAEVRLLQMAIHSGAREILVAGWDLGAKGYFGKDDGSLSTDPKRAFLELVSQRYSQVRALTSDGTAAEYLRGAKPGISSTVS